MSSACASRQHFCPPTLSEDIMPRVSCALAVSFFFSLYWMCNTRYCLLTPCYLS
ncbi:hypothetical protein BJX64DRAFT_261456 [Aspergillus heterothallicus]